MASIDRFPDAVRTGRSPSKDSARLVCVREGCCGAPSARPGPRRGKGRAGRRRPSRERAPREREGAKKTLLAICSLGAVVLTGGLRALAVPRVAARLTAHAEGRYHHSPTSRRQPPMEARSESSRAGPHRLLIRASRESHCCCAGQCGFVTPPSRVAAGGGAARGRRTVPGIC